MGIARKRSREAAAEDSVDSDDSAEGAAAEAAPTDLVRVTYDGGEYFVPADALASSERDAVRETERFVRTSVTVYENNEDARIASCCGKAPPSRSRITIISCPTAR